jgi:hypothetical protein
MSGVADPHRDSYGLALAWLDGDMQRVAELLGPYELSGDELHLFVSVIDLVRLAPDVAVLRALLSGIALAGAGKRPE